MGYVISVILENGFFIAIFALSTVVAYATYKGAKNAPGASLLAAGFMMYGLYGLLAFTGPGFTGSFFRDFSKVAVLNSDNFVYFVSFALRAGIVFIIAGIYRMAGSRRTQ